MKPLGKIFAELLPDKLAARRLVPIVLIVVAGTALSIAAFLLVHSLESQRQVRAFERIAIEEFGHLENSLEEAVVDKVHSIRGLYAASGFVTRSEFKVFVSNLDKHGTTIQAFEWIPRVPESSRAAYEKAAQADGHPGFRFTERERQGRMIPAGSRAEYFPVYYVQPLQGNEAAFGFDLGSNSTRLKALRKARDTGGLVATERITLVQEDRDQFGFLVFLPVFGSGAVPATVAMRRKTLTGFVLGVYQIAGIVRESLAGREPREPGIEIYIFDASGPPGRQLLYPKNASAQSAEELTLPISIAKTLPVADRDWKVVIAPAGGVLSNELLWHPWAALVAGLLFTALLSGYSTFGLVQRSRLEISESQLSKARIEQERIASDLATLIDTANAPIFGIDTQGRVNEWNQSAVKITGYSKEEAMGHDLVAEFISEDDQASVKAVFDRALQGEETDNYEFPLFTKQGQRVDVLLNSTTRRDSAGNIVGVVGIGQDITERKRAEQHLRESEEQIRLLLDSTAEAIFGIDLQGNCLFLNPSCVKMLGYETQEDLLGKNMHDSTHHTHGDGSPYAKADCQIGKHMWAGKEYHNDEEVFWRADGTSIPVECWSHPIVKNNEVIGAMVTFLDVTERKHAQAQVIQASKLATLGEMATSVAHELNQPLNVISMAAGNLVRRQKKGTITPDYIEEKLTRITSQTARAAAIINHMRMFGRQASEKPSPIDPREMIRGAFSLMGEQLRLAGIQVEMQMPASCPDVLGHRIQMEQVMLNLLANSRDAIGSQPADHPKEITLACELADNGRIAISIRDTGGGIPESAGARLFEPFFTTKEMGKGTGLGLSVSYGIIQDMGGTIKAENVEGGAQFTISLPVISPS